MRLGLYRARVGGAAARAHVVVAHVLLYLVELAAVLAARCVSLRKDRGEYGDESTVEAG
jgi:hypothetical protein